jgi:hypothetical protein
VLKYVSDAQSLTSISIGPELVQGSPRVSVDMRVLADYLSADRGVVKVILASRRSVRDLTEVVEVSSSGSSHEIK